MFEKFFEFLSQFKDRIAIFVVIDEYEGGVVLHWGCYSRTLAPGLHWKWPIAERVLGANTVPTTMRVPAQSLTTKDFTEVQIASIVKYRIEDVRPFLLEIWDQRDVLLDVVAGATKEAVNAATYEELVKEDLEKKIIHQVRNEVNRYGFRILKITFTDMVKGKTIRLLQTPIIPNIDN
jgi:regulator of protease activity HflC (stomatin/prohibitin superfamily)